MILPPRSHQFRVAGSPGYSLPVFRGGAHPVWGLTAIITLQVLLCHRILSHTNQYFIFKFIELNRFSLVSPSSPPRHRLSPSDPFPVTAQVMTKAVKLFCANFSVGTFLFQFQSLFSCFQISRMGVESSSLLSGVIIDSSPILTTQDWSLHHAQVSAPIKNSV